MNQSKWNRWPLLSGMIFVILWVVAMVLVSQNEYLPDVEAVTTMLTRDAGRISTGGLLGLLSTFFLLSFAGSLRGALRWAGQNRDSLADIAFGSGLAAAVLGTVAFAGLRALAARAGTGANIDPEVATVVVDSWGQLTGLAVPFAFAAFSGATGLAMLRWRLLPAWFGWASVVMALGLLSPLTYVVMPLGLLWTAVLSLWLFARSGQDAAYADNPLPPTSTEHVATGSY